jgi:hypothetical protein
LRGATNGRDAAIHHVPRCACGGCGSFTGSQWIATGYVPAMDKGEGQARDDSTLFTG